MSFKSWILIASLLLSTVVLVTDSCTSSTFGIRKSKKPTEATITTSVTFAIPPSTTTTSSTINLTDIMTESTEQETEKPLTDKSPYKPDIYKHIHLCTGQYLDNFCLNGGTCYEHIYPAEPATNKTEAKLYACECSDHYTGSRCEDKSPEGSYGSGIYLQYGGKRKIYRRRRFPQPIPKRANRNRRTFHHRNRRSLRNISTP